MNAALSNNVVEMWPRRVQKNMKAVHVKKWLLDGREIRLWLTFSQEPARIFLRALRLKAKFRGWPWAIEFSLKHLWPEKEETGRHCFVFAPTWWGRWVMAWRGEGRNVQSIILCAGGEEKEIYKEEKLI